MEVWSDASLDSSAPDVTSTHDMAVACHMKSTHDVAVKDTVHTMNNVNLVPNQCTPLSAYVDLART